MDFVCNRQSATGSQNSKEGFDKGEIDRQLSGQSATTPIMKISDAYKSFVGKTSKMAVSFNALETIKRTNDSIDKLASLVSKMKVQMNKHDAQYKPQVY